MKKTIIIFAITLCVGAMLVGIMSSKDQLNHERNLESIDRFIEYYGG